MENRFWKKVDRKADNECWHWMAGLRGNGYGRFVCKQKSYFAHRIAYELHNKTTIPEGHVVRHKCDVRTCCNPAHLETGTQADNMKDMVLRGRQSKGETHGSAKLTEEQVRIIKKRLETYTYGLKASLAREFGISEPQIRKIESGLRWSHLLPLPKEQAVQ